MPKVEKLRIKILRCLQIFKCKIFTIFELFRGTKYFFFELPTPEDAYNKIKIIKHYFVSHPLTKQKHYISDNIWKKISWRWGLLAGKNCRVTWINVNLIVLLVSSFDDFITKIFSIGKNWNVRKNFRSWLSKFCEDQRL